MKYFRFGLLVLPCSVLFALLFIACEEPNDPDLPFRPYRQQASFTTRGAAVDVSAKGNYAAVADDLYGTVVLDVSDPSAPDSIFHYDFRNDLGGGGSVSIVELDLLHHYVASGTDDPGDPFPIHDFTTGVRVSGLNFGVPLRDFHIESTDDTLKFWASDQVGNDGLIGVRYCRENDQSNWDVFACEFDYARYLPPLQEVRGFGFDGGDLIALAIGEEGVHVRHASHSIGVWTVEVPGIAYDCAWDGAGHIVVAAQYGIDILDGAGGALMSSLVVPGADRLQQVVVQGRYACVLDINDGVYIYDISNPSSPAYLQRIDLIDPTSIDGERTGSRLYVTDRSLGLLIYTQ